MGETGWRIWAGAVQAAAFVCAAAGLALAFHVDEFGPRTAHPTANQISSLRYVFLIMLVALCLFGGPSYLYARPRFRQWGHAVRTGLVAGLVLGAGVILLALPTTVSSIMGGRPWFVEGKPILDGITVVASQLLFFTGLGLAGAVLVRAFVPGDIVDGSRNPARPHWRDALPLVAAGVVMATLPLDEERSIALGCFESPRSAKPVAGYYLHVPEDQLRSLATGLSSQANDKGWSIHGTVVDASDHLVFAQSLCLKRGLEVGLERDYPLPSNRLRITVFAQNAGMAWQAEVRELLLILGRAGQVTRTPDPKARAQPDWLLAIPVEPEPPAIPPSGAGRAMR
jgi:hypothetical protein